MSNQDNPILDPAEEVDSLSDEALGLNQPEETPAAEALQPEAEPEPKAEPEQPEPPADQQPATATEIAEQVEQDLILGKFKDQESLANAYTQVEKAFHQSQMERAEDRRRVEELEQRFQAATTPRPPEPEIPKVELPQVGPDFDWSDPEQVRGYVANLTEAQQRQFSEAFQAERARLAQEFQTHTQQFAQQSQEQQAQTQWANTIADFRSKHTDIDSGRAYAIAQVFRDNAEYGFTPSPENLEVAYQLTSDPNVKALVDRFDIVPNTENVTRAREVLADENLARYISANPSSFTDTDEQGWQYAKQLAAASAAVQVTPAAEQDARTMAQVATGNTGSTATAPGVPDGVDPEQWKFFGGDVEQDPLKKLF